MPSSGSLKSGDSIMLSCLSPRMPCCGPNAAASLMSPQAAKASSACVRSAVTDAGCASKATRRPCSGARKAGSLIKRSMPNFMVPTLQAIHRQSNRNDESPAGLAREPTPNMICGRLSLRSPSKGKDAIAHHEEGPIHPTRPAARSAQAPIARRSGQRRFRLRPASRCDSRQNNTPPKVSTAQS